MSCPSATGLRSTSIGAPAAMVEASGFIWEMKGQSVTAPPTPAAAPVATNKKSRRVGWSAEDAVVTIPTLSSYSAGGTAPGGAQRSPEQSARARGPRGGRTSLVPTKTGRKQQSRIVLLAPLPGERKPAIGAGACNARIPAP